MVSARSFRKNVSYTLIHKSSLTHSPFLSISKGTTYPQLNQSAASHPHSQSQHTRQTFKSALFLPCQHRSGELMQPSFTSSFIRSKARLAQKNPHHSGFVFPFSTSPPPVSRPRGGFFFLVGFSSPLIHHSMMGSNLQNVYYPLGNKYVIKFTE